jgi:heptosyltransferase-2
MNVALLRAIDGNIGAAIALPVFFVRAAFKKGKIANPQRILLIKFWGIGEAVLTLPAIRAVREKFPAAEITLLASNRVSPVYEHVEYVDEIRIVPLTVAGLGKFILGNFRKFDLALDFEPYFYSSALIVGLCGKASAGYSHSLRGLLYDSRHRYNDAAHACAQFLGVGAAIGAKGKLSLEPIPVDDETRRSVDRILSERGIERNDFLVGICAGAAESARERMWPAENFAALADMIIEKFGAKIAFVGSPGEKELNESVTSHMRRRDSAFSFAGVTNIQELFELERRMSVFISNDTGPMHIAAAQGVPTIGLFGPNLPVRFGPLGKNCAAIYKKTACSPCINVHLGRIGGCAGRPMGKCMKEIGIDNVMYVFENVYKQIRGGNKS